MSPTLYHFSEEPAIELFVPRPPQAHPDAPPLVWAVATDYAWTYLFPRDCPRVLVWPTAASTASDRERWFGRAGDGRVACIEWEWLARLREATLYRYHVPPASFVPVASEDTPWMYSSVEPVRPVTVDRLDDLEQALRSEGVELRLMASLAPLRDAWESTLHVSGIRLRNARDWPPD